MREYAYKNHDLMAEDIPLSEIAARFGTPLYVYSKASLLDHCRHIEAAFNGEDHLVCYAVKANANRSLLTDFAERLEGGDYFAFIKIARAEMEQSFRSVRVVDVGPHAAWYLCVPKE